MYNWIKKDLDYFLAALKKDFTLISQKDKPEEWKRDHYRYTFTVYTQRIYKLLNTQITSDPISPIQESTKDELIILRDMLNKMIDED